MNDPKQGILFSPHFTYARLEELDSQQELTDTVLLSILKDRFDGFYRKPIVMIKRDPVNNAFACGIICLSVLDWMRKLSGNAGEGSAYINWISNSILNDFGADDRDYVLMSETSIIQEKTPWRNIIKNIIAFAFYINFRCGLVHEGKIKGGNYFTLSQGKRFIDYVEILNADLVNAFFQEPKRVLAEITPLVIQKFCNGKKPQRGELWRLQSEYIAREIRLAVDPWILWGKIQELFTKKVSEMDPAFISCIKAHIDEGIGYYKGLKKPAVESQESQEELGAR